MMITQADIAAIYRGEFPALHRICPYDGVKCFTAECATNRCVEQTLHDKEKRSESAP